MHKQNRQDGAAAMITVIFVAIILSILTVGFIRLAINESRLSTDDDLTTRAFYAAESGIEDGKRAIKDYQRGVLSEDDFNADECTLPVGYSGILSSPGDLDTEYICQLIDLTPAHYQHHFDAPYQTVQVPLNAVNVNGGGAAFTNLKLEWHFNNTLGNGGDGLVDNVDARPGGQNSLPTVESWKANNYPAMLRLQIISHPSTGVGSGDIENFVAFVNPTEGAAGAVNIETAASGQIIEADCDETIGVDEYMCELNLSNFSSSKQYTMRLTNLYEATHFRASMSVGNAVRLFKDAQAVIDVTGRAGSVYRRIESVVDLSQRNILSDYAITSLKDICKNFIITDQASDFDGQANTSCTR